MLGAHKQSKSQGWVSVLPDVELHHHHHLVAQLRIHCNANNFFFICIEITGYMLYVGVTLRSLQTFILSRNPVLYNDI